MAQKSKSTKHSPPLTQSYTTRSMLSAVKQKPRKIQPGNFTLRQRSLPQIQTNRSRNRRQLLHPSHRTKQPRRRHFCRRQPRFRRRLHLRHCTTTLLESNIEERTRAGFRLLSFFLIGILVEVGAFGYAIYPWGYAPYLLGYAP